MPPKKPIIHDANGRKMTSTLGPYKVGEELIATCVTSAGKIEINVGAEKSGKFMYSDIHYLGVVDRNGEAFRSMQQFLHLTASV